MAEPKCNRNILFNEQTEWNLRLAEIGYNDFRGYKTNKLFRIRSENIIHYVKSGKGTLIVEDKSYPVKAGEFFLVPANKTINYYPDDEDPWRYYWFSLAGDASAETAKKLNLTAEAPVCKTASVGKIDQIFENLFSSNFTGMQLYYYSMSALMQVLAASQPKTAGQQASRNISELSTQVKELIELNYQNPEFTLDAVSKLLYISHSYMCKIFKEQVGCTPIAYLIDIRLKKAGELLANHNYSIKELCQAVGFGDELYFMKRFKQHYGMTVKAYRKRSSIN